jgi:probable HAF family extracellular repeat protein
MIAHIIRTENVTLCSPPPRRYNAVLIPGWDRSFSINAAGHVVVSSAVWWDGSSFHQIPVPVVWYTPTERGPDINDRDEVAFTLSASGAYPRGAVWRGGALEFIGLPGLNGATYLGTINNNGAVVGTSRNEGGWAPTAFVWNGSAYTDLGGGGANAINDLGHVCGWAPVMDSGTLVAHSVLWRDGQRLDLGTGQGGNPNPNNPYYCSSLNNRGQSVGYALDTRGERALIWSAGSFQALGDLGGHRSIAWGINNHGDVVGWSHPSPTVPVAPDLPRGFFWNGVMNDLTDLVNWLEPGWVVVRADDINDAGQIAAQIYKMNVGFRAVRLDPVPSGD